MFYNQPLLQKVSKSAPKKDYFDGGSIHKTQQVAQVADIVFQHKLSQFKMHQKFM